MLLAYRMALSILFVYLFISKHDKELVGHQILNKKENFIGKNKI